MARNRYISTSIWDDNWFISLGDDAKLLFLYLLTCPLTEIAGFYEITLDRMSFDTKLERLVVEGILKNFANDDKVYYLHGYICIINFIKHQKLNKNMMVGVEAQLSSIPSEVFEHLANHSKGFQRVSNTMLNTNININSNTNININDGKQDIFKENKKKLVEKMGMK